MNAKIDGSVALVTGSNRGIGRALVEELLNRGAKKVYATARKTTDLEGLKADFGDRVELVSMDVTDAEQVRKAAEIAKDVDILINNAGIAVGGDISDAATVDAARTEFDVNVFGLLQTTQAFTPTLKTRSTAAVVNIVSVGGLTNFPFFPLYSASKAAVHSLTQAQRMLLAAEGIAVHGVYPGPVDTDMARAVEMEKATPQSVASNILEGVEKGNEDIFPDAWAENFGERWHSGPKNSERDIASMLQES